MCACAYVCVCACMCDMCANVHVCIFANIYTTIQWVIFEEYPFFHLILNVRLPSHVVLSIDLLAWYQMLAEWFFTIIDH